MERHEKKHQEFDKEDGYGEKIREKLTELGVSIDGLKGKALTLRYNEVMDSQSDSDSQPDSDSQTEVQSTRGPVEKPTSPQDTHTLHEQQDDFVVKETVEIVQNSNGSETEIHRHELIPVDKSDEKPDEKPEDSSDDSQSEDPAAGTGLNKFSAEESEGIPQTTAEFKQLFEKLGIDQEGLKGKRAYKLKYDEWVAQKDAGEDTEDMSDDDLEEDKTNYVEVDFEGIEYLEDEETSKIYNTSHVLVGEWNADGDDIIWASEKAKSDHNSKKD